MDGAAKNYFGQFGVVHKPSKESQRQAAFLKMKADQKADKQKGTKHCLKISLGTILRQAGLGSQLGVND